MHFHFSRNNKELSERMEISLCVFFLRYRLNENARNVNFGKNLRIRIVKFVKKWRIGIENFGII